MTRKTEKGSLRANQGIYQGVTLREEKTGTKQVDVSSILRTKHLQSLATWASREARVASLAAFLGEHLAAKAEASGIPLDPSTLLCERCETTLQPGINCTIRIEKITNKSRQVKKSRDSCQNNVVCTCHFCSHPNLKWGTAKGYVHALLASPHGHTSTSNSCDSTNVIKYHCSEGILLTKELQLSAGRQIPLEPELSSELNSSVPETDAAVGSVTIKSLVTPLLNRSNKKRKGSDSTLQKVGSCSVTADSGKMTGGSSKRRRKGWSSLKEIVESNESEKYKSFSNFAIPFLM